MNKPEDMFAIFGLQNTVPGGEEPEHEDIVSSLWQWIHSSNLWTGETEHQMFHGTWGASEGKSEHIIVWI